jgi:hypothetical protein
MNKRCLVLVLILTATTLVCCLAAGTLAGCASQSSSPAPGIVTGIVTLEGSNDHAGAIVTVSGTTFTGTTTQAGEYFILNVPAGTYTLTCAKNGYDALSQTNLTVKVNEVTSGADFYLVTVDPPPLPF